jgi:hypothetical protein
MPKRNWLTKQIHKLLRSSCLIPVFCLCAQRARLPIIIEAGEQSFKADVDVDVDVKINMQSCGSQAGFLLVFYMARSATLELSFI